MKKKQNTVNRIKEKALQLFNEQDTLSITTNHIAKACGISPGNLYYHFKNKEQIILSLYKDLSTQFLALNGFEKMSLSKNPLHTMKSIFDEYGELFFNYRFLLRDSMVIIALNPEVKAQFLENQAMRIKQIKQLIIALQNEGILTKLDDHKLEKRAKLHWFITGYWQVFASSTGEVTKASISEAKEVFFEFLIEPFLTERGLALNNEK